MTAEWKCTACNATNRTLVGPSETEVKDRCYTCKAKHLITRADRPAFWNARAA